MRRPNGIFRRVHPSRIHGEPKLGEPGVFGITQRCREIVIEFFCEVEIVTRSGMAS